MHENKGDHANFSTCFNFITGSFYIEAPTGIDALRLNNNNKKRIFDKSVAYDILALVAPIDLAIY